MSEREATDGGLIDRTRAGDDYAFRVLVDRYEFQVAAKVIGMLGPADEADDVGQETSCAITAGWAHSAAKRTWARI